MNLVGLSGVITEKVELRKTPKGTSVANFYMENTNSYGEAHVFEVEVFGEQAERIAELADKGKMIELEGSLRQHKWVNKTTQQSNSRTVVKLHSFRFMN